MIAYALAPLLLAAVTVAKIPDLQTMQWESRVVLLFAPNADDSLLTKQKAKFEADPKGIEDRDIRVFEITDTSQAAAKLRFRFGVEADHFAIVLIGKDGGRKLKKSEPVELSALFSKVDSMPMRRDEMKRSSAK